MKKSGKRKLTLSKETVANLEAGKLVEVVGNGNYQGPEFSDLWEKTTCMYGTDPALAEVRCRPADAPALRRRHRRLTTSGSSPSTRQGSPAPNGRLGSRPQHRKTPQEEVRPCPLRSGGDLCRLLISGKRKAQRGNAGLF